MAVRPADSPEDVGARSRTRRLVDSIGRHLDIEDIQVITTGGDGLWG
jgi:hypothetical protein